MLRSDRSAAIYINCVDKKGGFRAPRVEIEFGNRRTRLFETLLLVYRSGGCSRGPGGSISPEVPRISDLASWRQLVSPHSTGVKGFRRPEPTPTRRARGAARHLFGACRRLAGARHFLSDCPRARQRKHAKSSLAQESRHILGCYRKKSCPLGEKRYRKD